jgi:hypothetical protein
VALATEHSKVRLHRSTPTDWDYPQKVARQLGWPQTQLQIRAIQEAE